METLTITPQMYEECVIAKVRCDMVSQSVQQALNEDDNYVSTRYLAIMLGLKKEKKDETKGTDI